MTGEGQNYVTPAEQRAFSAHVVLQEPGTLAKGHWASSGLVHLPVPSALRTRLTPLIPQEAGGLSLFFVAITQTQSQVFKKKLLLRSKSWNVRCS